MAVETLLTAPFESLAPGLTFESRGRTVTEADVVGFATLTGDFHPQHVDAAWSATSAFGERIAHGMLVLSYAVGLVPFEPDRVVALRGIRDATFKRPVRFGDTIRVRASVKDCREASEEAGLVTLALNVVNQRERTVCRGSVEVLWRRDDAPVTVDPLDGLVAA